MIIFITIPWFLPAFKAGGPIQSIANLVDNFSENVKFKIFCSNADLDNKILQNIEFDKWIIFNNNTEVFYASPSNVTKKLIVQYNNVKPDVLFIIGIFSFNFNIFPLLFCKAKKKILSVRGMLHDEALSQKKWKKKLFLIFLKSINIKKQITFHATNEQEKIFIQYQFGKDTKINIADNFSKKIITPAVLYKNINYLNLTTIAIISPMKNHKLVLEALANATSFINYNIYGPIKDANYWKECLQLIKNMPSNIIVKYWNELAPEDVQNTLAENHIFIMPSKSENFAHAIAEALGMGKPVITSHGTPWNFLKENNAGENVEKTKIDILNAIEFFAKLSNDEYQKYSTASICYFNKRNNTKNLIKEYHNLLCL